MFEITKEYRFSAAHALPTLPKDHKCHRLHGHNYVVTVCCSSDKLDEHGMVMDFAEIDTAVSSYIRELDHINLNDRFSFPTTSESLAIWLAECLDAVGFGGIRSVSVSETPATKATYYL